MPLSALLSALFVVAAAWPAHSTENGVTDSEILIGEVIGLSGVSSSAPISFMNGAKAFFDRTNAAGGIAGRKIKLIVRDDGYEPQRTIVETEKLLKTDKVFALGFYYGTPTVKSVVPMVAAAKIPMLFPFSSADTFRVPVIPQLFTVRVGAFTETRALLDYAIDKLQITEFGIIYQDDAFGAAGLSGVQKTLADRKLPLKYKATASRNSLDVAADLDKLKASGVKVVFLYVQAKPAAEYIKQAREKGVTAIAMGPPGVVGAPEFVSLAGAAADGSFYSEPLPWRNMSIGIVASFWEDCKRQKVEPDMTGFEGYIGAAITVEALRRTGKDLTREKMEKALEELKDVDIGGIKISLSAGNHVAYQEIGIAKVQHGKFVDVKN